MYTSHQFLLVSLHMTPHISEEYQFDPQKMPEWDGIYTWQERDLETQMHGHQCQGQIRP